VIVCRLHRLHHHTNEPLLVAGTSDGSPVAMNERSNVIDLHLHTTASDGRSTPEDLVRRAYHAGIRTISVTDHDTMAAVPAAAKLTAHFGMTFVPGVEITSVHGGKDVHVLGYFLTGLTNELRALIAEQRLRRAERAREIAQRLAALGAPIDERTLLEGGPARGGKSVARPQIAQALIAAGHVATVAEAFDRYLGEDGPAYVPHCGATPSQVVGLITRGGGLASFAHPGTTRKDEIIPDLVADGLGAIEAYHSAHDDETVDRYLGMARQYGLAVTGGSDFHGEGTRRSEFFGRVNLPAEEFRLLQQRAADARGMAAHRLGMAWGIA
jgi:predicted metal-dependent phosphoesterase TrpH